MPNYKLDELKKQNLDLIAQSDLDARKLNEVTSKYEQLEEEHIFIKAKLTSDKESLQSTNETMKGKLSTVESELDRFKRDNIDLTRKIVDMQAKYKELEGKQSQNSVLEHERKRLLASLQEKSQQYERLASENEMNKDLSLQWKKEVENYVDGYECDREIDAKVISIFLISERWIATQIEWLRESEQSAGVAQRSQFESWAWNQTAASQVSVTENVKKKREKKTDRCKTMQRNGTTSMSWCAHTGDHTDTRSCRANRHIGTSKRKCFCVQSVHKLLSHKVKDEKQNVTQNGIERYLEFEQCWAILERKTTIVSFRSFNHSLCTFRRCDTRSTLVCTTRATKKCKKYENDEE